MPIFHHPIFLKQFVFSSTFPCVGLGSWNHLMFRSLLCPWEQYLHIFPYFSSPSFWFPISSLEFQQKKTQHLILNSGLLWLQNGPVSYSSCQCIKTSWKFGTVIAAFSTFCFLFICARNIPIKPLNCQKFASNGIIPATASCILSEGPAFPTLQQTFSDFKQAWGGETAHTDSQNLKFFSFQNDKVNVLQFLSKTLSQDCFPKHDKTNDVRRERSFAHIHWI